MDPNEQQKLDQSIQSIIDNFSKTWSGLYRELLEHGLDPAVAVQFVKTYIKASMRAGMK